MRKTRAIQLRVTDEEHAKFNACAKEAGLSVSEWLRALAHAGKAFLHEPQFIKESKPHKTFFKKGIKS